MIKKVGEFILWVLLATILVAPFIYIYLFCPNASFYENIMSNLLATGLALVAGIPVALWVDRRIKHGEDEVQYKMDRLREANLLGLIREELNFSYTSLFLKGKKGNMESLTLQPLKSDLWDSFIAGEDIKYIEEPDLLNKITSAYYALKSVKNIEWQAYIAHHTSAITFTAVNGTKSNAAQRLLKDARTFDALFEKNIEEALKVINERINILKKYES